MKIEKLMSERFDIINRILKLRLFDNKMIKTTIFNSLSSQIYVI
jgi:hypothetical protein